MATVFDYLNKIKQENPELRRLDNISLYKKLKGTDENLPSWSRIDNPSSSPTRKTDKQDPSFMNSLFDWTDYGINETSARFVKSAYNNSITGLAYQYYNGEAKYDLTDYNPGIVDDILSAVISFSMPLDIASMFVGGYAGKALTGLGSAGIKAKAVDALVGKKAFTKEFGKEASKLTTQKALKSAGIKQTSEQARREVVEQHVNNLIKDRGMSALYSKSQSIMAGAAVQGATLATFEGVRGGFQAAVDGDDVWSGIGHGVMHGGVMGALSGVFGASLNIKHGELLAKYSDDVLTFNQKVAKTATGIPGQIIGESAVFSVPELKNVMEDENYGMRELMRSFVTNAGMMGVLKAKGKLWNKGKEEIGKWADKEGLREYIEAKDFIESIKKTKQSVENLPENTPAEKAAKKAALEQLSDFRNRQLRNAKIKVEEYENWEKEFDKQS